MGGDDGPGEVTVQGGGTDKDIEETGGHKGKIQVMLQKILAPKVLLMIQPYLQRFEEKMVRLLFFWDNFLGTTKKIQPHELIINDL